MVLFSNLIWEPTLKLAVGISMIVCVVSLLAGNTIFIAIVSMKGQKVKSRAKYIKKKHDKVIKERQTALATIQSANHINLILNSECPDSLKLNRLVFSHEQLRVKNLSQKAAKTIISDKFGEELSSSKELND